MKTKLFEKISVQKFVLLCAILVLAVVLVCQLVISGANDGYTLKLKDGFDQLTIQNGVVSENPIILFEKSDDGWLVSQLPAATSAESSSNSSKSSAESSSTDSRGSLATNAEKFSADSNTCIRIEDFFAKIEVVGVVSHSGEDERFGFGENSIFLTASRGGKVVRRVEIGKNSLTSQQVYCRIDGSSDVVLVSGDLRQLFERDFERFKS